MHTSNVAFLFLILKNLTYGHSLEQVLHLKVSTSH